MSFQAYMDNIETKTGKTPNQIIAMAKKEGLTAPEIKTGKIMDWLKKELGLGHGHAMAMAHVIKNGAKIPNAHAEKGPHKGGSNTVRLSGKKKAVPKAKKKSKS